MIKTCFNCYHFHSCLAAVDNTFGYHIHDYCDKLNMVLKQNMESEVNKFLEDHWQDKEDATKDTDIKDTIVYDDFETGDAGCWMFEENYEKTGDQYFLDNKRHNRILAIQTIKHMLATDRTYNKWEEGYDTIYERYGEPGDEDYDWLIGLLARLEGEENDYSN